MAGSKPHETRKASGSSSRSKKLLTMSIPSLVPPGSRMHSALPDDVIWQTGSQAESEGDTAWVSLTESRLAGVGLSHKPTRDLTPVADRPPPSSVGPSHSHADPSTNNTHSARRVVPVPHDRTSSASDRRSRQRPTLVRPSSTSKCTNSRGNCDVFQRTRCKTSLRNRSTSYDENLGSSCRQSNNVAS